MGPKTYPDNSDNPQKEIRRPKNLQALEGDFVNYFYCNVSQSDDSEVKEILSNLDLVFLFVLDEHEEMLIGIENPFAQHRSTKIRL